MAKTELPHIVLAEDEPASRMLLARHLSKAGYEVTACENGRIALDAIQQRGSCIVVADWMMPEMDGLELCRTVRGLCETDALGFVYYILLTAHSEKEQIVAGLEAGADDYLTKPYHKQELLARLRAGERIFMLQADLRAANRQLEQLANTDMLTGLANRRHLFERFAEMWSMGERKGRPLGCVMLDIDKFKSVNDTYGHAAGDYVLKNVARTCRDNLRPYDILGRFGGEEFCIISPENDAAGTAALADRIRRAVAESHFEFEGQTIPVTISLGVGEREDRHAGPDDLIAVADAMLYQAKENGRNQVWVHMPDGDERRYEGAPNDAEPCRTTSRP